MTETAPSIFAQALGEEFAELHPMLQKRFGVGLAAGYGCVGEGVMTWVRRGPWWTVPFLHLGRVRNILIPDVGENVPFRIDNFPYLDPFGRETVTFVRQYRVREKPNRFDATMILDAGRIVDYLGTHQHLAVDLELLVDDTGALLLTSDEQRFYEGPVGFRFPMLFSGRAFLRESYDDATGLFSIRMEVHNRLFGFLFGYEGTFRCEFVPLDEEPPGLRPLRHERRA